MTSCLRAHRLKQSPQISQAHIPAPKGSATGAPGVLAATVALEPCREKQLAQMNAEKDFRPIIPRWSDFLDGCELAKPCSSSPKWRFLNPWMTNEHSVCLAPQEKCTSGSESAALPAQSSVTGCRLIRTVLRSDAARWRYRWHDTRQPGSVMFSQQGLHEAFKRKAASPLP